MTIHDQGLLVRAGYELIDPTGGLQNDYVFLIDLTPNPCDGNMKMTRSIQENVTYICINDVKRSKFPLNSPPKFAPLRIL